MASDAVLSKAASDPVLSKAVRWHLDAVLRRRAIAAASSDHLTLGGRSADAPTAAAERRTAALGLALVILEHEEVVGRGAGELGSRQGLIGSRITPGTCTICGNLPDIVVGTDRLVVIGIARTAQLVIGEALASKLRDGGKAAATAVHDVVDEPLLIAGVVSVAVEHEGVCEG